MPDWSKLAALAGILAMLVTVAVQQGRIMQQHDDMIQQEKDFKSELQRLETALVMQHPDTARALGFAQE